MWGTLGSERFIYTPYAGPAQARWTCMWVWFDHRFIYFFSLDMHVAYLGSCLRLQKGLAPKGLFGNIRFETFLHYHGTQNQGMHLDGICTLFQKNFPWNISLKLLKLAARTRIDRIMLERRSKKLCTTYVWYWLSTNKDSSSSQEMLQATSQHS